MKEKRLLKHDFKWVPPHERKSRFPGMDKPHRIGPLEKRKPLLWVIRSKPVEMKSDLFLINDSEEILEEVVSNSGGFASTDDDIIPATSKSKVIYNDVQPGEAVKIEEYELVFDSDFVLSVSVKIKSKNFGEIELSTPSVKGGIREAVLMWDTKETN